MCHWKGIGIFTNPGTVGKRFGYVFDPFTLLNLWHKNNIQEHYIAGQIIVTNKWFRISLVQLQ